MTRLNIGSGEMKLPGFINIDSCEETKPDLVCDIRKSILPFESATVNKVYCIHNIEHIELCFWPHVFTEFRRVLIDDGLLVLMYPEFEVCVDYFLNNKVGIRDFWRACLYGRQAYPGDYHVTPVISQELKNHLSHVGFKDIKYGPEDEQPQYSIMRAYKAKEMITKETLMRSEIFNLK